MAHRPKPSVPAKGSPGYDAAVKDRHQWYKEHGGMVKSKDERSEKKITNNDRQWSNLEQYILTSNIDKTQRVNNANKNLFSYYTFRQIEGPGTQLVNKLRGVDNVNVF